MWCFKQKFSFATIKSGDYIEVRRNLRANLKEMNLTSPDLENYNDADVGPMVFDIEGTEEDLFFFVMKWG